LKKGNKCSSNVENIKDTPITMMDYIENAWEQEKRDEQRVYLLIAFVKRPFLTILRFVLVETPSIASKTATCVAGIRLRPTRHRRLTCVGGTTLEHGIVLYVA
jgi:hypothetical protein